MIVYTSEKERCCSANKGIARERERHGDAQTRLHLRRSTPTVESEIPIAAIAVTNIPRVGGTKAFRRTYVVVYKLNCGHAYAIV